MLQFLENSKKELLVRNSLQRRRVAQQDHFSEMFDVAGPREMNELFIGYLFNIPPYHFSHGYASPVILCTVDILYSDNAGDIDITVKLSL